MQIDRESSDQRSTIRLGRRSQPIGSEFFENESIDGMLRVCGSRRGRNFRSRQWLQ